MVIKNANGQVTHEYHILSQYVKEHTLFIKNAGGPEYRKLKI